MKNLAILIILLLTGCTTTKPIQVVSGCPRITIPVEPHYPAQDLKAGDVSDKVFKATWATIVAQDSYKEQLLSLLEVKK